MIRVAMAIILVTGLPCLGAVPAGSVEADDLPERVPPTAFRIAAARDEALARLAAVRRLLEERPSGEILARELDIPGLEAEIVRGVPDGAALGRGERSLRRIVPGRLQAAINDLRGAVGRLGRLARSAADAGALAAAQATLDRHFRDPALRLAPAGDLELREAFAQAASLTPDDEVVVALRQRLSLPNAVSFVGRDLVAALGRRHFDQPVATSERREGTAIAVSGRVGVDLTASAPESGGENLLLIRARGAGSLVATADRRRIHVGATATPKVECTQRVHIAPRGIAGDDPEVDAEFRSRLRCLGIDGALGACGLVRRIAGNAIQDALAANDPLVAREIEDGVRERVREEGITLAYRVNGLLQHAVWDQFAALDYRPDVRLHNDADGVWSETFYAHDDELAALGSRPPVPAGLGLDLCTWVHESVANNSLDTLANAAIDEATVRGLWHDQFKMSSADWDGLPEGRVPAVITLAEGRPLGVRFLPGEVRLELRATGCSLDGRPADEGPRTIRVGYRVERGPEGVRFLRDAVEFGADVPAAVRPTWERALNLFLAADIRPMQRFPNAKVRRILEMAHLDVGDGWIVVGSRRVADDAGSGTVAAGEAMP